MSEEIFDVRVTKDLEDLIPGFMQNRHKELDSLRVALAAMDFDILRQLGHRMKGLGNSYGFKQVSNLGKEIEEWACARDCRRLEAIIVAYGLYLSSVRISFG